MLNLLLLVPIILVISFFFTKEIKNRLIIVTANIILCIYIIIISKEFEPGGGFGDMIVTLESIIILFISIIQGGLTLTFSQNNKKQP